MLLDFLAVYRLTRLVTADDLTAELRDLVVQGAYTAAGRASAVGTEIRGQWEPRTPPAGAWAEFAQEDPWAPKIATLVTCRWCASMWIGAGVLAVRALFPKSWRRLSWVLSSSAVATLLARIEE